MSYRMEILESRLFVKAWFDRTCEPQTKKYYHCMLNDLFKEIIFYLFKIVSNQIPEHKFIRKNTNFRITAASIYQFTTVSHNLWLKVDFQHFFVAIKNQLVRNLNSESVLDLRNFVHPDLVIEFQNLLVLVC